MPVEKRTLQQRALNRIFSVPGIAQFWARCKSRRAGGRPEDIPFARLRRPLSECRLALLTTGGIHLPEQPPFDMADPDGDATCREIPGTVDPARLVITHRYYDHRDADRDPNVLFPLDHLRDLVARNVLGSLAAVHFGLMGHIDGGQLPVLTGKTAPEIAEKWTADRVDLALLTPA